MTEEDWLVCANPTPMWWIVEGRASDRKLRLVACACCRRIWHLLSEGSKQIVESAEHLADGLITVEEAQEFLRIGSEVDRIPLGIDEYSVTRSALISHRSVIRAVPALAASFVDSVGGSREEEARCQCALVRDIVGNPFHPAPTLDLAWLGCNDGAVRCMAQAIYAERAFDRLPILADALEDAGCDNADILQHCRSEGPHVRGCWVIDLLLGKS